MSEMTEAPIKPSLRESLANVMSRKLGVIRQWDSVNRPCDAISGIPDAVEEVLTFFPGADRMFELMNAEAERFQAVQRAERAEAAISWALGEGDSNFGDLMPDNPKPPYWWRTELRRRANPADREKS